MDSSPQAGTPAMQVTARSNIVKPMSVSEMLQNARVKSKFKNVVVPKLATKGSLRTLCLILMSDLPCTVPKKDEVNSELFSISSQEYVITERGSKILPKSHQNGLTVDTLQVIAETLCQNAGRPLWTEGNKVDRVFYYMVIDSFGGGLLADICSKSEVKLAMAGGGLGKIGPCNEVAECLNQLQGMMSTSYNYQRADKEARDKISDYCRRILHQITAAEKISQGKSAELNSLKESLETLMTDILAGKYYLSARERIIDIVRSHEAGRAESMLSRIIMSPFRQLEAAVSVQAQLEDQIELFANKQERAFTRGAYMNPTLVEPYRPLQVDQERRLQHASKEEKEMCLNLEHLSRRRARVPPNIVAEALDLGWDVDWERKTLRHPHYPEATATSEQLADFFANPVSAILSQGDHHTIKEIPIHSNTTDIHYEELKKRYLSENSTDHHSHTLEDAKRRLQSVIDSRIGDFLGSVLTKFSLQDLTSMILETMQAQHSFAPRLEFIAASLTTNALSKIEGNTGLIDLEVVRKGSRVSVDIETATSMLRTYVMGHIGLFLSKKMPEILVGIVPSFLFAACATLIYRSAKSIFDTRAMDLLKPFPVWIRECFSWDQHKCFEVYQAISELELNLYLGGSRDGLSRDARDYIANLIPSAVIVLRDGLHTVLPNRVSNTVVDIDQDTSLRMMVCLPRAFDMIRDSKHYYRKSASGFEVCEMSSLSSGAFLSNALCDASYRIGELLRRVPAVYEGSDDLKQLLDFTAAIIIGIHLFCKEPQEKYRAWEDKAVGMVIEQANGDPELLPTWFKQQMFLYRKFTVDGRTATKSKTLLNLISSHKHLGYLADKIELLDEEEYCKNIAKLSSTASARGVTLTVSLIPNGQGGKMAPLTIEKLNKLSTN